MHELCIRIMESSYVPAVSQASMITSGLFNGFLTLFTSQVMEEIYACALLNSPQDKLLETLDLIQSHRSARKRNCRDEVEINDKLVIDAMYARVCRSRLSNPFPFLHSFSCAISFHWGSNKLSKEPFDQWCPRNPTTEGVSSTHVNECSLGTQQLAMMFA